MEFITKSKHDSKEIGRSRINLLSTCHLEIAVSLHKDRSFLSFRNKIRNKRLRYFKRLRDLMCDEKFRSLQIHIFNPKRCKCNIIIYLSARFEIDFLGNSNIIINQIYI